MLISSELMRAWLYICLFTMALVAAFYLRRRSLSTLEYILWGLLVVMLPALGPYIVIAARPGQMRGKQDIVWQGD
jgi:hypothetical protein